MTKEDVVHVAIDVETTDLSWSRGEIVKVSVFAFNPQTLRSYSSFSSLVKPNRPQLINPKSMKVNGITKEQYESAPNPMEVKSQFMEWWSCEFGKKLMPHGYNYSGFDKNFLFLWLGESDYDHIFHHRTVNIDSVLRFCALYTPELFPELENESLGLENVTNCFDLAHRAHDSDSDAFILLSLMRIIRQRISK